MPHQKPIVKKHFDVKIECTLPATVVYRVLAENEEEAIRLTKTAHPISVRHRLIGMRKLKATVYDAYSTLIRLVKNMAGMQ